MEQDNNGLVWLGTGNGLVSFNGYELTTFRAKNAARDNLDSNIIRSIAVTNKNHILVGTYAGLFILNKGSSLLTPIELKNTEIQQANNFIVFDILTSTYGKTWLATSVGLISFQTEDLVGNKQQSLSADIIHYGSKISKVIELKSQLILFATNDRLYSLDQTNNKFEPMLSKNNISQIQALYQRESGEIIVGTRNGLYQINQSTEIVPFISELGKKNIYDIVESKDKLWIGTRNFGLYSIDKNSTLKNSNYSSDDINSLADSDAYSLLIDRSDNLWVGSFNGGVSRISLRASNFEYFSDSKLSLSCLISPVIYTIYRESNSVLWLGTQKGLARIDSSDNTCRLLTNENSKLSGLDILGIFPDKSNARRMYVSTRFSTQSINLDSFEISDSDLNTLKAIKDFFIASDGTQYAATNSGLYRKKVSMDNFHKIENPNASGENIFKIVSINDRVFFSSWKGLLQINQEEQLKQVNWSLKEVSTNTIRALNKDQKNRVWVGIDNIGLFSFNSNGKLLYEFRDAKKLTAIEGFSAIEFADNNNLWISSTAGISHINLDSNEIINYKSVDGLANSEYTNGASFRDGNGGLYFGNRKGLTYFKPEKIELDDTPPKIQLTKFLYFNEALEKHSVKRDFSLPAHISVLKKLELTHIDYVFGFEFAGLHYADPSRNNYAFMLEEWDEEWNYVDAKSRKVTYSNLPAGNYIFKVKASNSQGVWTEAPFELPITIHPPWWKTYWAYAAYIITFLLSIFLFINYRTKALEARARQLELNVEQRTKELATEKEKVEQLLSRKNEEFANVSHEFRTPLTLILGPIAQLLKHKHDSEETSKLNVVQRNGYRLLRMVDQLLNLETFRVKSITQRSPQPIGQTTQMLAEAFKDLAEDKSLQFTINNIEPINFEFTPDAIEKIVLNLLSNAIKYTPQGGSIKISARRVDQKYQITVKDTGIGIPKEKIDSVFERFNRVLDENSEKVTGAGIGLALVKSLVDSHDGKIDLASQHGKGTEVTVTLPIINEVETIEGDYDSSNEIVAMELMSLQSQQVEEFESGAEIQEDSTKPSILVIEDNPDMRNYIGQSIQDDYQVFTAVDGVEGLEKAKELVPDLIISDVMMPRMDGYQTTNEIRRDDITSHIPVLLLTARGDKKSRLKGWYEKADEYITKPFDVDELKIRVNNLLEIRNILKKRFSESVFEKTVPQQKIVELGVADEDALEENKSKMQEAFIEKLNSILEKNYTEAEFTIEALANSVAMSERQLFRKLRSVLDMTPAEYIRRFRLEKSKLFLSSGKSAQFTATEIGFASQSYFSRCFKAQFGVSPSQFVKQNK